MSSSGNNQKKLIVAIGFLLIAVLLGWEAWKRLGTAPKPVAAPPNLPPIEQPLPIGREAPPAPAVPHVQKPHMAAAKKAHPISVATPAVPHPLVPTAPGVPPNLPVVPAAPPPVTPTEWQGKDTSVTHSGQVVIRNDHQWISFWAEHHPDEAAPDVDFTRNMVIGVFSGSRPADQFAIQIVNVRATSNSVIAEYREVLPPTGTFAVNVSVYPYDIKVIPRTTLPVKFNLVAPLQR